jgi:hypothetical protein
MLIAKSEFLIPNVTWEYAFFIAIYFLILRRAEIMNDAEINMIGEIRESVRSNVRILIPQAFKSLES